MTSAVVPDRRGQTFRTDVQGLRAVAVGLVLLYHAGVPPVTGGYVGVDAFFVISGFLITTHLLQSIERDGRIHFTEFYARRIRRILPASLTVAALTAIAVILFYPPLSLERALRDGVATIVYMPNIWFAMQQTDYLADHSPSPYQHYWSLGVEEQFYLFWPLVLLLVVWLARRRKGRIIGAIVLIAGASMLFGVLLTTIDQPTAFFSLPTRAWQLLVGGLVGALLLYVPRCTSAWLAAVSGWLGLAMLVGSAVIFDSATAFPGAAAMLPTIGIALVIYFGAQNAKGGPGFLLSLRPMQFVGLISYSLYLVHWPLLVIAQGWVGEEHPLPLYATVALGILLALPLGWLLFRYVETPARTLPMLARSKPRVTVVSAVAITAIVALGCGGATLWASVREIGVDGQLVSALDTPVSPPPATGFVPGNMTPALRDVSASVPSTYADGCHLETKQERVSPCVYGESDTIVSVFGDSHAEQWVPAVTAIAEQTQRFSVSAYVKSNCPAVDVTVIDQKVPYLSCDRWREAVLQHLEEQPPDVVIISSYAYYELAEATSADERTDLWASGVRSTVERLQAAGSRVLVIADTPRFAASPATCVSANVNDTFRCAGKRNEVLDATFADVERAAVRTSGGMYLDVNEFICNKVTCPPIVANVFVYRDVNHLTSTFTTYMAPVLRAPIADELD